MSEERDDFWKTVETAATRVVDVQNRVWQGAIDVLSPKKEGEPSEPKKGVGSAARTAGEQTASFARDYVRLTTSYYRGFFELGRAYTDAVAKEVLGVGRVSEPEPPAPKPHSNAPPKPSKKIAAPKAG